MKRATDNPIARAALAEFGAAVDLASARQSQALDRGIERLLLAIDREISACAHYCAHLATCDGSQASIDTAARLRDSWQALAGAAVRARAGIGAALSGARAGALASVIDALIEASRREATDRQIHDREASILRRRGCGMACAPAMVKGAPAAFKAGPEQWAIQRSQAKLSRRKGAHHTIAVADRPIQTDCGPMYDVVRTCDAGSLEVVQWAQAAKDSLRSHVRLGLTSETGASILAPHPSRKRAKRRGKRARRGK
jgi:hypothetical protein